LIDWLRPCVVRMTW